MGAITDARAEKLSIGDLSELTGVNIETIRYYERIKMVRHHRARLVAVASTSQPTFAFWPLYVGRVS